MGKYSAESVVGRNTVGQFEKRFKPFVLRLPEGFDANPIVTSTKHAADGNDKELPQQSFNRSSTQQLRFVVSFSGLK
ncbi:hypothetical protein [Desulfobulbus alkaliphilus]|uniref:hypothetical protein n=1 Tax=Desulfobulbus alkaliphilus TaxID=869814 RepID=UPI0030840316